MTTTPVEGADSASVEPVASSGPVDTLIHSDAVVNGSLPQPATRPPDRNLIRVPRIKSLPLLLHNGKSDTTIANPLGRNLRAKNVQHGKPSKRELPMLKRVMRSSN